MRTVLLLILLSLVFFGTDRPASAQYIAGENICRDTESEFYRPVYPIYEYRNRRIVLKDIATRADVQEVEINLELPEISLRWSPNCRYLLGKLRGDSYIVWDTLTNQRVASFAAPMPNVGLRWDPRSEYILYPASFEGTYLWHIPTDTKTLLSDNPCGFIFVHWDYERGQMLGLQPADINPAWCSYTVYSTTVQAHDLQTGTLVRSYSNPSLGYISLYTYTPDMRYIIVFPREGMEGNAFTIWDRDTGLGVRAAMNWPFVGAPQTSPDMRYVAVGGYRKVRIWNIENLEADPQPRDPLYRLEVPMEIDWRWISPTVIEIISFRGTEYFDVASGTYIDAP